MFFCCTREDSTATINRSILWEREEDVEKCRDCQVVFTPKSKRHHCENCEGIYCDNCLDSNVKLTSQSTNGIRCCKGCYRGEAPGEAIKSIAENLYSEDRSLPRTPVQPVDIIRGGMYGEDGEIIGASDSPPPARGYFEFLNKTEEVCCVKVLKGQQGLPFIELSRPCYLAVPPLEAVHAAIPATFESIYVIVLHGNPYPLPLDTNVIFDTRSPGMRAKSISPSVAVVNFPKVVVFRINCQDKNVLLKYKGNGYIDTRKGNIATVLVKNSNNFMSRITSQLSELTGAQIQLPSIPTGESKNKFDFSTNVDSIETVFKSTAA